ncbi:MAG: ACP S-malonyltransferase [Thermotogae bacterium]|nr:ACP S-malonyltransferase [Thermotogota bacterium]HOO73772.1 ACP S-malonyltransferase [Tepiditoga sp.]
MISFVFPGQGSQYIGMGNEIIQEFPEYRKYIDIASEKINTDIYKMIYENTEENLKLTENAQPAILTISYIKYLYTKEKLNIMPDIVLGHSLGEWTAIVAAGVIPFEDAVYCVRARGKLMSSACPPGKGSMAAVMGADMEVIKSVTEKFDNVVIANHNSPVQIVLSGDREELLEALLILKEKGIRKTIELNVSGPFHSPLIIKAQQEMEKVVENIEFRNPDFPVIQNVSAFPETDGNIIKENIIKQITSPVRWVESIEKAKETGVVKYYEIGPGKVLTKLIKTVDKEAGLINV